MAVLLFHSPSFDAHLVECNYFNAFRLLRFGITLKQVAQVLHYFVAELHSHALFRQRPKERLQHQLPPVSAFVAREIRCQTFQLVARNKGAIGADDHVVQVVADRELLAQSPDRGVFARVVQALAALLVLPQIRRPDFAVACQRAVGVGFRVPAGKITDVAARFAILEGHQHRHH